MPGANINIPVWPLVEPEIFRHLPNARQKGFLQVCFFRLVLHISAGSTANPSHHFPSAHITVQQPFPSVDGQVANMGSTADSSSVKIKQESGGLGNQALLEKIDKLRALNIGAEIPLPQVRPDQVPHLPAR